ncbi:hypothetical protein FXV91_02965 [Methanosarcina sp. DH2]|uniref:hypothetical protein n=1 Tax=Methanosarcina sp. DH2 TaxID=2605639 RepID=UPI001E568B8A|nr:hypothetical protein [Methanosarcina sp. DH2]MCC4769202.1 hypothetical protein [Methanosarcina sp. DH2]
MENSSIHKFCSVCETRLKRQVMGSNVFYYCRSCGRVSSEACLSGGVDVLHVQKSLSAHRVSSTTDLKLSEDTRNAIVGT